MRNFFALAFLTLMALMPLQIYGETKILAIAGSTREGSYNKLLIKEAAQVAEQLGATVKLIDLKNYPAPFYEEDLESIQGMPEKMRELRKLMVDSQIILIASPEYNASISAILKNSIDWASRGEQGGASRDAFKGKRFVLLSASLVKLVEHGDSFIFKLL